MDPVVEPIFTKMIPCPGVGILKMIPCPAARPRTEKYMSEGEGEVALFSAKRWDPRNRADLIESATPCHDAQVVGPYRDSNPLRLTVLAAMSEDYTTAPQHLQVPPPPGYPRPRGITL